MSTNVTHVPLVRETRWSVSQLNVVTEHVRPLPPTVPTDASHLALIPPAHSSGLQQYSNVGGASDEFVEFVVSHQPARDATMLPPGHDAPSGQTRHSSRQP